VSRAEIWVGYAQIATALGVSSLTLRRWLSAGDIKLPVWNQKSPFLYKAHLPLLLSLLFESNCVRGLAKKLRIRHKVLLYCSKNGIDFKD